MPLLADGTAEITMGRSLAAMTRFQYPVIFVEGPRGTSKTRSILSYLLALAFQYPGSRILLCRRWRAELTKTILMTLEEEVFPSFGLSVPGGAHRQNRSEYLLENNSLFLPVGIDDGAGIWSMGITFAYIAEVLEMEEQTVTDIAGSMRWIKSPERPTLPPFSQMILDANPGPPAHWANQRAEPVDNSIRYVRTREQYERLQKHNYAPAADPIHRWKRIVTKHQDNPGYWDVEKWDYTDLGRKYVTETLEGLTGHKRERWLHGLWKSAEGGVYPEFDEDKHVIKPFEIPQSWPCVLAYDAGFDHPTAIIVAAIAPTDAKFICAEYVFRQKTIEEDARWMTEVCRRFNIVRKLGDPHSVFHQTKFSSGKSIAQQLGEFGHSMSPAPAASNTAELAAQVEMVRTELIKSDGTGDPMLQVFDCCPNVIRGFQTWSYRRNTSGQMLGGEDKFEDVGDDEMDCIRMIVSSRPRHKSSACRVYLSDRDEYSGRRQWYSSDQVDAPPRWLLRQ